MRSTNWVMETNKKGGRVNREKNKTDKAICMLPSTPHPPTPPWEHKTTLLAILESTMFFQTSKLGLKSLTLLFLT